MDRIILLGDNNNNHNDSMDYTFQLENPLELNHGDSIALEQIHLSYPLRDIELPQIEIIESIDLSKNQAWNSWQNTWNIIRKEKSYKFAINKHKVTKSWVNGDFRSIFQEEEAQSIMIVLSRMNVVLRRALDIAWSDEHLPLAQRPKFIFNNDGSLSLRADELKYPDNQHKKWRHHKPENVYPNHMKSYWIHPYRIFTSWDFWLYNPTSYLMMVLGIAVLEYDNLTTSFYPGKHNMHIDAKQVLPYEGEKRDPTHPLMLQSPITNNFSILRKPMDLYKKDGSVKTMQSVPY